MGNVTSNTTEKVNTLITEKTLDFLVKNSTTITAENVNINTIDASGINIKNCNAVTFDQSITATSTASGEITSQTVTDFQSYLQNESDSVIDNSTEQKNGWLAIGFNVAVNRTKLKNDVKEIIKNTVTVENSLIVNTTARNTNLLKLRGANIECSPYRTSDIKFTQNIKSQVAAEAWAKLLTTALMKTITDNSDKADVSNTTSQTNKGLDDLIKALAEYWLIVLAVIIAILSSSCVASFMMTRS